MKTILSLAGLGLVGTMAFAGWVRNPEPAAPAYANYAQSRDVYQHREVRDNDRRRDDDRERYAYGRDHDRDRDDRRYFDRDDRYRVERERR